MKTIRQRIEELEAIERAQNPTDWSKVKVDTKVWARDSDNGSWIPCYFSEYIDGIFYAFPYGSTSFSATDTNDTWAFMKLDEENK